MNHYGAFYGVFYSLIDTTELEAITDRSRIDGVIQHSVSVPCSKWSSYYQTTVRVARAAPPWLPRPRLPPPPPRLPPLRPLLPPRDFPPRFCTLYSGIKSDTWQVYSYREPRWGTGRQANLRGWNPSLALLQCGDLLLQLFYCVRQYPHLTALSGLLDSASSRADPTSSRIGTTPSRTADGRLSSRLLQWMSEHASHRRLRRFPLTHRLADGTKLSEL